MIRIGLIGDRDDAILAHRAIPAAIDLAAATRSAPVEVEWIPTDAVSSTSLERFHGLWCVPATPYRSMDGALRAIRYAREHRRPLLGTCGGFQHAVLEYARNVLGWQDAEHAETAPEAERLVVAPLECTLVEVKEVVRLEPGSRLRAAYGTDASEEGYHCRFGFNPAFEGSLAAGPLHVTARDAAGGVRGLELDDHPFFVLTLFQPERAALRGVAPPIVVAFLVACVAHAVAPPDSASDGWLVHREREQ